MFTTDLFSGDANTAAKHLNVVPGWSATEMLCISRCVMLVIFVDEPTAGKTKSPLIARKNISPLRTDVDSKKVLVNY
jgi:hypothetical protein